MIKVPIGGIPVPSYKLGLLTRIEARLFGLTDNPYVSARFHGVEYSIHVPRYDEVAAALRAGQPPTPAIRLVPTDQVKLPDLFPVKGHMSDVDAAIYGLFGIALDTCQFAFRGEWFNTVPTSVRDISDRSWIATDLDVRKIVTIPAYLSVPDYRIGAPSYIEDKLYQLLGVHFVSMGANGEYRVLRSQMEEVAARLDLA